MLTTQHYLRLKDIENEINIAEEQGKPLHNKQIEFLTKIFSGSRIAILNGPPGAGKSHILNIATKYAKKNDIPYLLEVDYNGEASQIVWKTSKPKIHVKHNPT